MGPTSRRWGGARALFDSTLSLRSVARSTLFGGLLVGFRPGTCRVPGACIRVNH